VILRSFVSIAVVLFALLAGCSRQNQTANGSLAQARQGFTTKLVRQERANEPVPQPPPQLFNLVRYPSPAGELAAYLSPPPSDGQKHPAIIWIFGGFDNGIGDTAWEQASPDNDQSARAFREAGLIMMYPSLRGGNDNPGFKEGFYGEVDDIIAAADFLARQSYVDPKRIYLGGHSTGGTLALLVAEATDKFRAVFAFGPVEDVTGYGTENLPFDTNDPQEVKLRAPIQWLAAIKTPTFVFEGQDGNFDSLRRLKNASQNWRLSFHELEGFTHFSILAAITPVVAKSILKDKGPAVNITFTAKELNR
jgi:dipeptidyl aminopeptidase/acylaminoacyl peptidase